MPTAWSCYLVPAARKLYCRFCFPYQPLPEAIEPERHTPAHCSACGRPLRVDWSEDCLMRVIESCVEWLHRGPREWSKMTAPESSVAKLSFYQGRRPVEVVRDWATMMREEIIITQPWVDQLLTYFLKVTTLPEDMAVARGKVVMRGKRYLGSLPRSLGFELRGEKAPPVVVPGVTYNKFGEVITRKKRPPENVDDDDDAYWAELDL